MSNGLQQESATVKTPEKKPSKQLGFWALFFLVISAMVGGGIFNLPQSAALSASPAALFLGWATTGLGIMFLVGTFRILSRIEPELSCGLYTYAETGFGKFVSFLVAYGYWICNCIATVAYGILIASTLSYFFPGTFDGTNWQSAILISCIIWSIVLVNLTGARHTAVANSLGTVIKFVPIVVFICMFVVLFNPQQFAENFFVGPSVLGEPVPFFQQVTSSFFVTVFLFIGIEGAVVVSGQATNQKAVAKATFASYVVTLAIYIVVSILAFGVFSGESIAQMPYPSLANLMQSEVGGVATFITNLGIIISVSSSWLVWILMLGQMPLYAARDGVFPPVLAKQNKKDAPWVALIATALVMECVVVFVTQASEDTWNFLVKLTPIIAMPCYFVCCLFLLKRAWVAKGGWHFSDSRVKAAVVAVGGLAFTTLLVASSETRLFFLTCTLYACGLPFYVWTRRRFHARDTGDAGATVRDSRGAKRIWGIFGHAEFGLACAIFCLGVVGALVMFL